MKGYGTTKDCPTCQTKLVWFLGDKLVKNLALNGPKLYPLFCVPCREKFLVMPPEKASDLFTGWSKDYLKHPKDMPSLIPRK